MKRSAPNVTLGTKDPRLLLDCPHVVLTDVEYFHDEISTLVSKSNPPVASARETLSDWIRDLGPHLLAYCRIPRFHPGMYSLLLPGIKRATKRALAQDLASFAIDSGALLVIDYSHLAQVARTFTAERYEEYASSEQGDDSVIVGVNAQLGGPYFALVNSFAENPRTEFRGDGTYMIQKSAFQWEGASKGAGVPKQLP
jgi:hypothetical protein